MAALWARRRLASDKEVPVDFWMFSFSDLMTLLLTFFVLRFAMSSLKGVELTELLDRKVAYSVVRERESDLLFKRLAQRFRETLGEPVDIARGGSLLEYEQGISLAKARRKVVVSLPGATFLSGRDELSPVARTSVRLVGRAIVGEQLEVRVAGHTDPVPVSNERFRSNWELSTARAIEVARQLIDVGIDGKKISAIGYADQRPIDTNATEAGRAKNRRVEISIAEDNAAQ